MCERITPQSSRAASRGNRIRLIAAASALLIATAISGDDDVIVPVQEGTDAGAGFEVLEPGPHDLTVTLQASLMGDEIVYSGVYDPHGYNLWSPSFIDQQQLEHEYTAYGVEAEDLQAAQFGGWMVIQSAPPPMGAGGAFAVETTHLDFDAIFNTPQMPPMPPPPGDDETESTDGVGVPITRPGQDLPATLSLYLGQQGHAVFLNLLNYQPGDLSFAVTGSGAAIYRYVQSQNEYVRVDTPIPLPAQAPWQQLELHTNDDFTGEVTIEARFEHDEGDTDAADRVKVFPIGIGLIAHRTGEYLGNPVSEQIEDAEDPADYVILTNNDFDADLPNGLMDYDNLQAELSGDDDLAQITLQQLQDSPASGTVRIELSDADGVRLFRDDGSLFYDFSQTGASPLTLDIANPSGYLAGILSGDLQVWLEGLSPNEHFVFSIVREDAQAQEQGRDEAHMTIAEWEFIDPTPAGGRMLSAQPIWKDALLQAVAAGEAGWPLADYIEGSYFKNRITGVGSGVEIEMEMESLTDPADNYVDTMIDQGTTHVSEHYSVMYDSSDIYQAAPDTSPLSGAERADLLEHLGVHAAKNDGVKANFKTQLDWHARRELRRRAPVIEMEEEDVLVDVGTTVQITVRKSPEMAGEADDWEWNVGVDDGQTIQTLGPETGDTVFNVLMPNNAVDVKLYVSGARRRFGIFAAEVALTGVAMVRVADDVESLETWQQQSWRLLRVSAPVSIVFGEPVSRNRRITELYALMYNQRQTQAFKWSGAAAFASYAVGDAMSDAARAANQTTVGAGLLLKSAAGFPDPLKAYNLLSKGNLGVYDDVYFQHLAFDDPQGGMGEILRMNGLTPQLIVDRQKDGWEDIDDGLNDPDQQQGEQQVWDGNQALLKYEQEITLQNMVYNPEAAFWADLTNASGGALRGWFIPEFPSPVPGQSLTFQQYRLQDANVPDNASFGNFDARWEFMANVDPNTPQSVWDAWKAWSDGNGQVNVATLLSDGYNE